MSSCPTVVEDTDSLDSVALAARIAVRTSERSLPSDASKAKDLAKGASLTYLSTVADPHLPWICIRQMSMPLEAKNIAPVTLKVWPVNRGAPDSVWVFKLRMPAMAKIDWTVAFLVAATPANVGNNGEDPACDFDDAQLC